MITPTVGGRGPSFLHSLCLAMRWSLPTGGWTSGGLPETKGRKAGVRSAKEQQRV